MKRLIILLLLLPINCFSQHIELVSEVCDTMVAVNKTDLDIINTVFYRFEQRDSLNKVNEQLISILESEILTLQNISFEQKAIIQNKEEEINTIKNIYTNRVSSLEKQLKRANRNKTF